jgi:hypothetical protein
VTFEGENFGIINFETRPHLVVKSYFAIFEKSLYFDHVTTKNFFRNFISIFSYIINPQEISEQPTHYSY